MSLEHQPRPSESHKHVQQELEALGHKRLEQPRPDTDKAAEQAERSAEQAREIIQRHEPNPEEPPEPNPEPEPSPKPPPLVSAHLDRSLNYHDTLGRMQRQLKPASRAFSKVIHSPIVEQTSEVLEQTVMRPSVITGATWSAAIVGSIFYFTARFYGYMLSGFEMLGALVMGALLGILLEVIARLLRRRR